MNGVPASWNASAMTSTVLAISAPPGVIAVRSAQRAPKRASTAPFSHDTMTAATRSDLMAHQLLLDTSSLMYRAYFGLPTSIKDPEGRPVNAVHGCLDMTTRLQ